MDWISVKDRLPKKRTEYLVFQPEQETMGSVMVAPRRAVVRWTGKKWITSLAVTHWMPLPDPPEVAQ